MAFLFFSTVQLTFEHGFEWHRSTYMWVFLNKHVLPDPRLDESGDVALRIPGAVCKVIGGFSIA